MKRIVVTAIFLACGSLITGSRADDWPQWLGPKHDSVWRERGVVREFPAGGLPIKWRAPVGWGYSGPSVADGRVYLMDYQLATGQVTNNAGGRDQLTGKERVVCLDSATGKVVWVHAYERSVNVSFSGGPRCTPAVADGKVYAIGIEGDCWCLDARTGHVHWKVSFTKQYGAKTPIWGYSAQPRVEGDLVYCIVGGEGSVVVAFDKETGKEVWRALSASEQGYCPPSLIESGGTRQLLVWHGDSLNSLDPATGKLFWNEEIKPNFGMAIAAPRLLGDHLLASAYGNAAMFTVKPEARGVEVLWRAQPKTGIFSANVTPFLEEGVIYGCDIETGALMAVSIKDGQRLWETRQPTNGAERRTRYGTAFPVKNGDRFFLFNELGDLIVAKLSPKRYEEISRFHVLEPTNKAFGRPVVWSHPAFAQRCMFARNDQEVVCVDLADR